MRMTLTLYSTDSCQLCERALQMLRSMPELADCTVEVVDVALDERLLETHGPRLPVLGVHNSERELGWPFNADDVLEFADSFIRG